MKKSAKYSVKLCANVRNAWSICVVIMCDVSKYRGWIYMIVPMEYLQKENDKH